MFKGNACANEMYITDSKFGWENSYLTNPLPTFDYPQLVKYSVSLIS